MSGNPNALRVVLEHGKTKVFASALDWPGWSRQGKKTPEAAIEALLAYRERFEAVLALAEGVALPEGELAIRVEADQPGDGATDFGVPGKVAESEHLPLDGEELDHQIAVLQACWAFFDQVAARVSPTLRKGPRGGGRDRDVIVEHVLEAERGYVRRNLDLKHPEMAIDDPEAIAAHRAAIVAALREHGPHRGLPGKAWPVRYTIRRMAWHVLDHAWEMEDKDRNAEDAQ
jgi:hypothetical protein